MEPPSADIVDLLSAVDTSRLPPDGGERFNRLIFEKSPYLLQHAENPVDWYPWGEAALSRARAEDRPIFLSIGYSTCHWCHVMAHESFEDGEVARLLNRHFVAIKVDREERPDLDATYMTVCQMMTGSGGWPLNLCLTPGLKPFFAATYLPKTTRRGMSGLLELLSKIAELWLTDRGRLLATGEQAHQALQQIEARAVTEREPSPALLNDVLQQYRQSFDAVHGGFGDAPKFPAPHNLALLLRLWQRTGADDVRVMALETLRRMRLGGVYDQIGFGLHRYSVDASWLVPHFEKMLYDQALAALACLDAFQATGDPFYGQTAREILDYVRRDLGDPGGAFCCGEDADSEGAEGTFYLWTPQQVKKCLGEELGDLFCRSFGITEEGNFEGRSIPHLPGEVETLARDVGMDAGELAHRLAEGSGRLLAARQQRVRPHRDDKILAGWNGLAIAAFSRAGAVLDDPGLVKAAERAAGFLLDQMRRGDGRLLRRWRRGEAAVPAFLEDYAFLCWGLIELCQAGFEPRHLAAALDLTRAMLELFDDGRGGLFDTGRDAETPLTRGRSLQDGAVPSGAAVATLNLLRLGRLCGDDALYARGERLLRLNLEQIGRYPAAYAFHLIALDYALGPATDVVLAGGEGGEPPTELLAELRRRFLPRTTLLFARPGDAQLAKIAPTTVGKGALSGRPAAWVCRDRTCHPPVDEAPALSRLLDEP